MAIRTNKNSFWQALIIALIIFWTGILVGIFFEDSRVAEISEFYSDSEASIVDFELSSKIVFTEDISCQKLNAESVIFADRIYQEAIRLESYDNSNKITDRVAHWHKKYDILRTSLWKRIIDNKEKCDDSANTVVYLYDYLTEDFDQISTQKTMGNYLTELKKEEGDNMILIPIAVDTGFLSIGIMQEIYGITTIPAILVNEENKIDHLSELETIKAFLN
jgi:hypothetical protein